MIVNKIQSNIYIPEQLKNKILDGDYNQIKSNIKKYGTHIFWWNWLNAKPDPVKGEGLKRKPKKKLDFMEQV